MYRVCMSVCVRCLICVNIQVIVSECEREHARKMVFQESTWRTLCVPLVKVAQSWLTLSDPMDYTVHGALQARILEWGAFPFSRGIFPTQGLNPGLPHCRWILYQLSYKGSPRILEWVAYPFSREASWPRDQTRVSHTAGRFFTSWATREAQEYCSG